MNKKAYLSPHTDIMKGWFIYMQAGTNENPANAQTVNNVELDSNSSSFDDEEPLVSSNIWE